MMFIVIVDGKKVIEIYAPNYETALKRAIDRYGENVYVEEK